MGYFLGFFRKETSEGIEMSVLSTDPGLSSTNTPPVQCSSRNSMSEGLRASKVKPIPTPADSMEYINAMLSEGTSTPPLACSTKGEFYQLCFRTFVPLAPKR